jgi:hypothetical protein
MKHFNNELINIHIDIIEHEIFGDYIIVFDAKNLKTYSIQEYGLIDETIVKELLELEYYENPFVTETVITAIIEAMKQMVKIAKHDLILVD